MNGWSRSSLRPSSNVAASASVRATMMPGHPHDVELEARGVEALDLLVLGDEHLAALVAALLGARLLVLDVIAGHADLDESPDQVAHVRVAAVPGVGVGDDERPEVDLRRDAPRCSSVMRSAGEVLVPVGGEQRAHDAGAPRRAPG